MESTAEDSGGIEYCSIDPTKLLEKHQKDDYDERKVNRSVSKLLQLLRNGVGFSQNCLDVVDLSHDQCIRASQSLEDTDSLIVLVLGKQPARSLVREEHKEFKQGHKASRNESHNVEGDSDAIELDAQDVREHHSKGDKELVAVAEGPSLVGGRHFSYVHLQRQVQVKHLQLGI